MNQTTQPEVAIVVGVGPALGAALARRFAKAGMSVGMAARGPAKLARLVDELKQLGVAARAYACDATDENAVTTLFTNAEADLGTPNVVVFNAGAFVRKGLLETSTAEFERCWRVGCLGGFLVGRAAARAMLARTNEGSAPGGAQALAAARTIIFTGATASLRGGALFHNLAVGKFGLRALAQSMARELQPRGIHVAHVIIDGQIRSDRAGYPEEDRGPDAVLDPDAIAETYYQLHRQTRSAWSLELDLRPWVEKF
jgi:NAD(P)-dependent dehydrogenase (short-subunit alcohol dehydrogenase family)